MSQGGGQAQQQQSMYVPSGYVAVMPQTQGAGGGMMPAGGFMAPPGQPIMIQPAPMPAGGGGGWNAAAGSAPMMVNGAMMIPAQPQQQQQGGGGSRGGPRKYSNQPGVGPMMGGNPSSGPPLFNDVRFIRYLEPPAMPRLTSISCIGGEQVYVANHPEGRIRVFSSSALAETPGATVGGGISMMVTLFNYGLFVAFENLQTNLGQVQIFEFSPNGATPPAQYNLVVSPNEPYAHIGKVVSISALQQNPPVLLTCGMDNLMRMWSWSQNRWELSAQRPVQPTPSTVTHACYDEESKALFVANTTSQILVFTCAQGTINEFGTLQLDPSPLIALEIVAPGVIGTLNQGGLLKLWRSQTGRPIEQIAQVQLLLKKDSPTCMKSVTLNTGRVIILIGLASGAVQVYEGSQHVNFLGFLNGHDRNSPVTAMTPSNDKIFLGFENGRLCCFSR